MSTLDDLREHAEEVLALEAEKEELEIKINQLEEKIGILEDKVEELTSERDEAQRLLADQSETNIALLNKLTYYQLKNKDVLP